MLHAQYTRILNFLLLTLVAENNAIILLRVYLSICGRILQAEVIGVDPKAVDVPVFGGHAGITILPILSQVRVITRILLLFMPFLS